MAFQSTHLDALVAARTIAELDVVRLQDGLTHDGPVTEAEARLLCALERSRCPRHPTWKALFIDAISMFTIHDIPPDGYLTAAKADWLIREAAPAGRILTPLLFELLTAVVGAARWTPERMVVAFLDEVYCAVANADGPLRTATQAPPGQITERDTDVLRHILYAAGGSDRRAITRAEAAGLLAIDAACDPAAMPPAWIALFAKALGDAAMTASGHAGPEREIYLAHDSGQCDAGNLIASLKRGLGAYTPQSSEDIAIAALERQRLAIVTGDEVEACTAEWLAGALSRDAAPTPSRAILMAALAEHARLLHPALADLTVRERSIRAA